MINSKSNSFNFQIYEYCSLDLDKFPKLENYTIESAKKNIIFTKNNKTKLKGLRYIDSDIKIDEVYNYISIINDDYLLASINDEECIIDKLGNTILKLKDKKFYGYENGYFIIKNIHFDIGVIDSSGKELVKCEYRYIETTNSGFIVESYDGHSGVINFDGKVIIPINKREVTYKNGYYIVRKDFKKYGIRDSKGKKILKEKYDRIIDIRDNIFYVLNNNRYYALTKDKKKICEFAKNEYYQSYFGDTFVSFESIDKEYHYIIVDNEIKKVKCSFISKFINGIAYIKIDSKYYLIDKKCNIISDSYDCADYKGGKIILKKDNQSFYVDQNNEIKLVENNSLDNYKNIILKISSVGILVNDYDNKISKFIFQDGNIVDTPELYDNACMFSDFILCMQEGRYNFYSLYTKDGKNVVPLINNQIFVLNDSKIVIANHVIDLSEEYLDLNISYNLLIRDEKKTIFKSFNTIDERSAYIKQIEKYIEFLNDEINKTKEKLDLLECMTLEDIDNEVLESCKKYEKK